MDFIYERIKTPQGVKLEIITGGARYKGKVWVEIASQIYCENGKDGFREIGHFSSGAPFLYGEDVRISISHTEGCYVVATVPVPGDALLSEFSPQTALGVDVEKDDREKVLKLRDRFLSDSELPLFPEDSLEGAIIAWTSKEAMLKAFMNPDIDWRHDIVITSPPSIDGSPGKGYVNSAETRHEFSLFSMRYEGYIITFATSAGVSFTKDKICWNK